MRPLTTAMRAPRRRARWMRLGQISVSTRTSRAGLTRSRTRVTGRVKSNGAKNTPSAPRTLSRATACPVSVVVETNTRWPGNRAFSGWTRMRAVSTSPTETAWIQMDGPPAGLVSPGTRPMRSESVRRYFPVPRPFHR